MTAPQARQSTGKTIALMIVVAIVAAVAVTLAQKLVLGHSSVAVTGGVVGAVTAAVAITAVRKKSD